MTAHRERGAALLSVLLLVVLVAAMAAVALERLRVSTRLASNAVLGQQARAYAQAAETMATLRLDRALRSAPDRVTLAGGWNNRPYALPVPGGVAVARIGDAGNCFNLNGLVTQTLPGIYRAEPAQVDAFVRLLQAVGVPGQAGTAIAAAAADWIDSDQDATPGGTEDAGYRGGRVPYLTPGTLMADPSELRAVAGVTPDIYARVRPWLCTLPVAQPSAINVNTLLPEQAVLAAAAYGGAVSPDQVRRALMARPPQGWGSTEGFTRAGNITATAQGQQLGVKTQWFALAIDVSLGTAGVEEHALIDATSLPVRLVQRQWGEAT